MAIFQEPVRNSAIIRAVRAMFPNRDQELSPYERPLTDGELAGFGRRYRTARARPFWLPHVRLAARLPVSWVRLEPVYQSDALLLRRFPRLATYAAVRVIELTK
jgi:hypothetical protein